MKDRFKMAAAAQLKLLPLSALKNGLANILERTSPTDEEPSQNAMGPVSNRTPSMQGLGKRPGAIICNAHALWGGRKPIKHTYASS